MIIAKRSLSVAPATVVTAHPSPGYARFPPQMPSLAATAKNREIVVIGKIQLFRATVLHTTILAHPVGDGHCPSYAIGRGHQIEW
jgi:hypothetical protein